MSPAQQQVSCKNQSLPLEHQYYQLQFPCIERLQADEKQCNEQRYFKHSIHCRRMLMKGNVI